MPSGGWQSIVFSVGWDLHYDTPFFYYSGYFGTMFFDQQIAGNNAKDFPLFFDI